MKKVFLNKMNWKYAGREGSMTLLRHSKKRTLYLCYYRKMKNGYLKDIKKGKVLTGIFMIEWREHGNAEH